MATSRPINPFARYKQRHGFTWDRVATELDRSVHTVTKLGNEQIFLVSPTAAKQFEDRTDGEIGFLDVMRWSYDRLCNGAIRDAA